MSENPETADQLADIQSKIKQMETVEDE